MNYDEMDMDELIEELEKRDQEVEEYRNRRMSMMADEQAKRDEEITNLKRELSALGDRFEAIKSYDDEQKNEINELKEKFDIANNANEVLEKTILRLAVTETMRLANG